MHKYPSQHPILRHPQPTLSLNMLYTTHFMMEIFRQTDEVMQTLQSQATN